jgi:hypothetical protein
MCLLYDTYYAACGHFGRRRVSHCRAGLHFEYLHSLDCNKSQTSGITRLEDFCSSCEPRVHGAETNQVLKESERNWTGWWVEQKNADPEPKNSSPDPNPEHAAVVCEIYRQRQQRLAGWEADAEATRNLRKIRGGRGSGAANSAPELLRPGQTARPNTLPDDLARRIQHAIGSHDVSMLAVLLHVAQEDGQKI